MRVDLFDFDLPEERIALRPADPRDSARLLEVQPGEPPRDHVVRDLPALLRAGDVLVVNDTRVIPARLDGYREREGSRVKVQALLHQREGDDTWRAFARPGKKLAAGDRIRFGGAVENDACLFSALEATIAEKGEAGEIVLRFDLSGPALDDAIATLGHMPLPPYIAGKRPEDERDRQDYQTLFAQKAGAVAAPTAGLHFTPDLMTRLAEAGIDVVRVTLHVGAGTFLPVKVDDTRDHRMHSEWGAVSEETAAHLNEARAAGGRIVCVGTTSLRLLESATDESGMVHRWTGSTAIFITPGYRFRSADLLMTNFHLPRSTLFMLVSAFSGLSTMREAYAHAIGGGYRFYSYGDASLLHRAPPAGPDEETIP
jgi:S-adenosylmethionine:tRNA ribosyltransferase-isomerase